MSSYGLGARDAPERNETILVLQELLIPVGGTGMGTITHHVKQVKICVIIKVKQGKAFLVKALKTEYSFVREEVAGERYYQLSCTRQASVSVKLMTPGKRGRPPPPPPGSYQCSAFPHQYISKAKLAFTSFIHPLPSGPSVKRTDLGRTGVQLREVIAGPPGPSWGASGEGRGRGTPGVGRGLERVIGPWFPLLLTSSYLPFSEPEIFKKAIWTRRTEK